ncbi:DUF2726 domain-containing protein [Bowmanella sp. JS7-9]|uniref:DUF2726 domain-containing protein n=1 Tax=Pseudobowmanella zhangzhouensis TaxID=1537679 RepID=A0ABW1XP86_9ALTE|nr:DUF2726 domain-containing protein [Bowmanella sp. JS7-9]TBX21825.1 QueD like protein [Bowmanella sp. JS7-9]
MELAIILMILLIVVAAAAIKLSDVGLTFPFSKKTNLYTPAERKFLQMLDMAVGDQYRIICRVRLSDIVSIRPNTSVKVSRSAMAQAATKQLDFVLCQKDTMSPVVAVDLVSVEAERSYKAQRDWYVSGALDAARIPHIRIKAKASYKPQEIRDCIHAKLAPLRFQQPQEPLVRGTLNNDKAPLRRPVAA